MKVHTKGNFDFLASCHKIKTILKDCIFTSILLILYFFYTCSSLLCRISYHNLFIGGIYFGNKIWKFRKDKFCQSASTPTLKHTLNVCLLGSTVLCWLGFKESGGEPTEQLLNKGLFTWYQGDFHTGASSSRFSLVAQYSFIWYKMSYLSESYQCDFTLIAVLEWDFHSNTKIHSSVMSTQYDCLFHIPWS